MRSQTAGPSRKTSSGDQSEVASSLSGGASKGTNNTWGLWLYDKSMAKRVPKAAPVIRYQLEMLKKILGNISTPEQLEHCRLFRSNLTNYFYRDFWEFIFVREGTIMDSAPASEVGQWVESPWNNLEGKNVSSICHWKAGCMDLVINNDPHKNGTKIVRISTGQYDIFDWRI